MIFLERIWVNRRFFVEKEIYLVKLDPMTRRFYLPPPSKPCLGPSLHFLYERYPKIFFWNSVRTNILFKIGVRVIWELRLFVQETTDNPKLEIKILAIKIPCLKIPRKKNSSEKKFLAKKIPCLKIPWKKNSSEKKFLGKKFPCLKSVSSTLLKPNPKPGFFQ